MTESGSAGGSDLRATCQPTPLREGLLSVDSVHRNAA